MRRPKNDGIDSKTVTDIVSVTSRVNLSCHAFISVRKFDTCVKANIYSIHAKKFRIHSRKTLVPNAIHFLVYSYFRYFVRPHPV